MALGLLLLSVASFRVGLIFLFLLVSSLSSLVGATPSLQDVIGSRDQERLKGLFEFQSLDSLETSYYVARGMSILGGDNKKVSRVEIRVHVLVVMVTRCTRAFAHTSRRRRLRHPSITFMPRQHWRPLKDVT